MSNRVIQVEGLSKQYQIGRAAGPHQTLRDAISGLFRLQPKQPADTIWALNDVSFDVNRGEVVGIIGRNGAGKSTLLKMLSRVTTPTKGKATIQGRVASLLEVGTGFHPELTGRENIFLNGAILGMSRAEIKSKFDQIVEFSEIGKFIDTPVKRYSSGMYVRLAFAVAAHIEPDVLIVDEVLSVGDIAFQKKCLGMMKDSSLMNRTVLFVTHNLGLVRTMCSRAILIDKGCKASDGRVENVVQDFLKTLQAPRDLSKVNLQDRKNRNCSGQVLFTGIKILDNNGTENWFCEVGDSITLEFTYRANHGVQGLGVYLAIDSALGSDILTTTKKTLTTEWVPEGYEGRARIVFPKINLRPGDYKLYLNLGDALVERVHDVIDQNVDIPLLSVSSREKDRHLTVGYFNMDSELKEAPCLDQ